MPDSAQDFLHRIKKSCPRCHKPISGMGLWKQLTQTQISCPHCLASLQTPVEQRHFHEAVLIGGCLLLSLTCLSIFPYWLQFFCAFALYRAGLMVLPLLSPLELVQPQPVTWKEWAAVVHKSWKEFLTRRCPSCHTVLSLEQRADLQNQRTIPCPSCETQLCLHPRDQVVNTFLLIWLVHQMVSSVYGRSVFMIEMPLFLLITSTRQWRAFGTLFSLFKWPKNARDPFSL